MEAYLQGQDLWDLVSGDEVMPAETQEDAEAVDAGEAIPDKNAEARKKWKIKCGKALYALRTSISKDYIDHVRNETSPQEIWDDLKRLNIKKDIAKLQFLENELVTLSQGGMSISDLFLKVKNLCYEIS